MQVYDPVVEWASAALQADFEISDSIFGTQQPERAIQAVRRYLEGGAPCTFHFRHIHVPSALPS